MKDSTKSVLKIAAVVGGVAVASTVVVVLATRRRDGHLGKAGRYISPEEITKSGGMTTKSYYKRKLPIGERVRIIQDMVAESVKDPEMRKMALSITRHCPARDGICEARAVYDWTRRNIRYTGDIAPHVLNRPGRPVEPIDLYQSAARTIEFGGGDCDDHTILGATMNILNGIPSFMEVTAPSSSAPDSHIYNAAGLPKTNPKDIVAMDTTLPGENFGKRAPYGRRKVYIA